MDRPRLDKLLYFGSGAIGGSSAPCLPKTSINLGSLLTDQLTVITFTPWTSDTPPLGWHFASTERNPEWLRFWNGAVWSVRVHESAPEAELERNRTTPDVALASATVWWRALTPGSLAWLEAEGVHWHGAMTEGCAYGGRYRHALAA